MVNKWMILNWIKLYGSITQESFEFPLSALIRRRFHLSFFHCSPSESPSRSFVLHLHPGCLRILRVVFPLLIVLVDREGSYWVLATLSFIWELWSNSMGVGKCRGYLKVTRVWVFSLILLYFARAYLHFTSFIWKILPSSRIS